MSETVNTFHNPRGSNCYTTRVNVPMRETEILKSAYKDAGEPQPDSDSTLQHNAPITDWMRSIFRGEVEASEVEVSEPTDWDDGYWPVEFTVTQDEFAALRMKDVSTGPPSGAFQRNGETAQIIKALLTNWCNEVVSDE